MSILFMPTPVTIILTASSSANSNFKIILHFGYQNFDFHLVYFFQILIMAGKGLGLGKERLLFYHLIKISQDNYEEQMADAVSN